MVDYISVADGISMGSISFKTLFGKGPVVLAKPQTFINASDCYDMDRPFAKLKLLPKGGHGGHNRMKILLITLSCREFPRLQIAIGRPPGTMDPINSVMRPFNKQESEETGLQAGRILLLEGINRSSTFVNSAKSLEQLR